jgi:hypothetical protein
MDESSPWEHFGISILAAWIHRQNPQEYRQSFSEYPSEGRATCNCIRPRSPLGISNRSILPVSSAPDQKQHQLSSNPAQRQPKISAAQLSSAPAAAPKSAAQLQHQLQLSPARAKRARPWPQSQKQHQQQHLSVYYLDKRSKLSHFPLPLAGLTGFSNRL